MGRSRTRYGLSVGDVLLLFVVAGVEVWLAVVLVLNAVDEVTFTHDSHRVSGQVRDVDLSRQGRLQAMQVRYQADDGVERERWVRVRNPFGPSAPPGIGDGVTVAYADGKPDAVRLPGYGGTSTASFAFVGWSIASGLTWWSWRKWSRAPSRSHS